MTNSRAKGARGEREWAKWLTDRGFPARRGVQYAGSPDSPDVVCDALPDTHFEVKRVEALNIFKACIQAVEDCGGRTPVVAFRRNGADWWVSVRAEDWLKLQTPPKGP